MVPLQESWNQLDVSTLNGIMWIKNQSETYSNREKNPKMHFGRYYLFIGTSRIREEESVACRACDLCIRVWDQWQLIPSLFLLPPQSMSVYCAKLSAESIFLKWNEHNSHIRVKTFVCHFPLCQFLLFYVLGVSLIDPE